MSILSIGFLIFILFGGRQVKVALSNVTIRSEEEGYLIECVNIYDQPAFENPLLKTHEIKKMNNQHRNPNSTTPRAIYQTWHKSGSCPDGTIPIIINHENFEQSKKDIWGNYHLEGSGLNDDNPAIEEQATGIATPNKDHFIAVMADIHIWQPKVEPEETSLAYISLIGIGHDGQKYCVIVGWVVNPSYYGDGRARIIVMRTGTTAFNLDSGFVQTNSKVSIDVPIQPISVNWSQSYVLNCHIKRDEHFNWRIIINDEELGYYPGVLLPNLNQGDRYEFGGKILNRNVGGKHTTTEMGNGFRPTENDVQDGAQITGIYSFDSAGGEELVIGLSETIITNPDCYNFVALNNISPHDQFAVAYGGSCK